MTDLNSKVFYKIKMDIDFVDKNEDYLWRIVYHIKNWLTYKWEKQGVTIDKANVTWSNIKNGHKLWSEDKTTVFIESDNFTVLENNEELKSNIKELYWACKIVEKGKSEKDLCPRHWVTEIGYEQNENKEVTLSCVISYSDMPGYIGPVEREPSPTLPRLILNILNDNKMVCKYGQDELIAYPNQLKAGAYPNFLKLLKSEERELPYIYISPYKNRENDKVETLINPFHLAKAVCGNAVVFYSNDMSFSEEMDYLSPKNYTCNNGKIRVYFPHVNMDNSGEAHKNIILFPSNIKENGEDYIIKIFRRALVQNVNYYEKYFRLDGVHQKRTYIGRKYRIEKLEEKFKTEYAQLQDNQIEELIIAEEQKEELEKQLIELQQQLDEKQSEIFSLTSQVEYMRSFYEKNQDMEEALSSREKITDYPDTPEKIVKYIKNIFKDKIDFSENAIKSLKDCRISCDDLWNVLSSLAIHMPALLDDKNNVGDPYKKFKHLTGINIGKCEGTMTRKDSKLMKQFITYYEGREIDIEPHITYPKAKQSIHFGYDKSSKKVIIGHCGEHLNIFSSPK